MMRSLFFLLLLLLGLQMGEGTWGLGCLTASEYTGWPTSSNFEGCESQLGQKYCIASVGLGGEVGGAFGLCMPTHCTPLDVSEAFRQVCSLTSCDLSITPELCRKWRPILCGDGRGEWGIQLGQLRVNCSDSGEQGEKYREGLAAVLSCGADGLRNRDLLMASGAGPFDLGDYAACQKLKPEGHYCAARYFNFISMGQCVPNSCGAVEYEKAVRFVCDNVDDCMRYTTLVNPISCFMWKGMGCPNATLPINSITKGPSNNTTDDTEVDAFPADGLKHRDTLAALYERLFGSIVHAAPFAALDSLPLPSGRAMAQKILLRKSVGLSQKALETRLMFARAAAAFGAAAPEDLALVKASGEAKGDLARSKGSPLLPPLHVTASCDFAAPPKGTGYHATNALFLGIAGLTAIAMFLRAKASADSKISALKLPLLGQDESIGGRRTQTSRRSSVLRNIVKCFDPMENFGRLFSIESGRSEFAFAGSIRVLSMLWIILGHTMVFLITSATVRNFVGVIELTSKFHFQFFTGGFFAVDTFLFFGGFFLVVSLLQAFKLQRARGEGAGGLFGCVVLHRYIRLTVPLAFVLLCHIFVTPFLYSGPNYNETMSRILESGPNGGCKKMWWKVLVYVNTLLPNTAVQECMGWTWYLAVDFQCFLWGLLVIFVYVRSRSKGWALLTASLVGSMVLSAYAVYIYHIPVNLMKLGVSIAGGPEEESEGSRNYFDKFYIKSYHRINAYMVGMAVAFLVVDYPSYCERIGRLFKPRPLAVVEVEEQQTAFEDKSDESRDPQEGGEKALLGHEEGSESPGVGASPHQGFWRTNMWWINRIVAHGLATALLLTVVFLPYETYRADGSTWWDWKMDVAYHSMARTLWSLGVGWFVLAMCWGFCGSLRRCLSANVWFPFSRLTYCVYLVHPALQFVVFGGFNGQEYFTEGLIWFYFFGSCFLSFFVATFVAGFVEIPVMRLDRLLLGQKSRR